MCSPREAKACDLCIGNDRSMKKTDSQWVRLLYGGTGADSSRVSMAGFVEGQGKVCGFL